MLNQTNRHVPLNALLILIVGALTVGPVLMLVIGSFSEGIGAMGQFTLDKYISAYGNPTLPTTLSNTLIFTLGTAVFSTILGALLAYLSVRTDIPMKGLFAFLPIVPMMIPHVLFSSAWITLRAGPRTATIACCELSCPQGRGFAAIVPPAGPLAQAALIHTCKCRV